MSQIIEKEAVSKFGRIYTKYKTDEWLFPCPKCKKANRENLHINLKTGIYHCFHCDYSGKLKTKYSLANLQEKSEINIAKGSSEVYLRPFNKQALTPEQIFALHKRGLSDEDIRYYQISGGKRIQIPNRVIGNFSDMICAWEWRKDRVTKYNPKYLYSEGVEKSQVLFNIQNIKENSDITLCEGIFNAITAGRNAVASYGCSLSDRQLALLLSAKPKSITIAYDSDAPGQKGALKALDMLRKTRYSGKVYYILLPKGVDINDLGKERYKAYYEKNKILLDLNSVLSCNLPKLMFSFRS